MQMLLLTTITDPDQTAPREQSDLGLYCLLIQSLYNLSEYLW